MREPRDVEAAATRSQGTFTSFPGATRNVLSMLQKHMRGSAVFIGYLDEGRRSFWIVDAVGDGSFGLEPGMHFPLHEAFCKSMATERAPKLCNDAASDPVYAELASREALGIGSYVGVPLEVSGGERVGSLCAISRRPGAYSEVDLRLLQVMADMLAYELERARREHGLRRLNEHLHEQATTDALTGLLNRRTFLDNLEREWRLSACRDGIPSYVVVADLDGFKELNDSRGHAAGDKALVAFADALRALTRGTDFLGRLGGDEFGIILVRSLAASAVESFCARAREAFARNADVLSGASLGAVALADAASPAEAMETADQRMYEDKRRRRIPVGPRP